MSSRNTRRSGGGRGADHNVGFKAGKCKGTIRPAERRPQTSHSTRRSSVDVLAEHLQTKSDALPEAESNQDEAMRKAPYTICVWAGAALLGFAGSTWAADVPTTATHGTTREIAGTYELVKRVMSDGKEVLPPAIGALYTMNHGRGNFNLFLKDKDGKLASESTISRYTLTSGEYCEWIVFTLRNNLDKPGVSNEAPTVTKHCSSITLKDGRIVFEPAGEGVVVSFDKDGFTATVAGQFVDHWKKIR